MSINISGFNPFVLFTLLLTSCGGQQETQEKDEDFKGNKYSDLNFVDDTNDDLKNILFTRLN